MRPSELEIVLPITIRDRDYLHIKGPPGIGKTQIPEQVARKLGVGYIHKHVPTCQPEDLALPQPTVDGRLRFGIADWLPLVGDPSTPDEGLINFDEMPQGTDEVQKTIANIIEARECYGFKIKPGWAFVSTGNREQDRAGARRILSHLRDRALASIELEPNLDDWCAWALDSGVALEVIAFLRFCPDLLCDFDPNREFNATARGWVKKVSAKIDAYPTAKIQLEMWSKGVGDANAAKFVAFRTMFRQLPNIDLIVMQPDTAPVPEEPSVRFAVATAVATRATEDNFGRIMTYARLLPEEYTVCIVNDSCKHAARKGENLTETAAFIDWAAKEGATSLGV